MGSLNTFCGSEFWNTTTTWNTDNPDFTSCFEKTVLVWVPFLFLVLFSPVDIYFIVHSKRRTVPLGFLSATKMVLVTGLIILCVTEFIYAVIAKSSKLHVVDVYTPVIKAFMFAYTLLLMLLNKSRGIHTSGLLFLFWVLLAIAGLPQFCSEIKKDMTGTLDDTLFQFVCYITYYVTVIVLLVLNFFAEPVSRFHSHPKGKKPSPEGTASFISKLTFMWFDKMAWLGYKRPLTTGDLWNINKEDAADTIVPTFIEHWNARANEKRMGSTDKPYSKVNILTVMWKCFGPVFVFVTLLRIIGDMMSFFNPILLKYLIAFVEGKENMWHGYLYAILMFVVAEVQTLMLSVNYVRMYVLALRIRTALVSAIYRKSMSISNVTKKDTTTGEIVNLMAVDAQRFFDLAPLISTLWSAPLQILLSTYFLWDILGWSAFAGIAVLILLVPVNIYVANHVKVLQTKQMKMKDERVKLMSEILSGIKVLKLYAWEQSYEEKIKNLRQNEMKYLRKAAFLNASTWFVWTCAPFIVSLSTFAVYIYTDERHSLNAEISFVSLSLFNIIRMPIVVLPMLISMLTQTSVSIKRINRFLNSEELDRNAVSHNETRNYPLIIENGAFLWDRNDREKIVLRNINVTVKSGALVAVVGMVGSGKSSLISAFLGEMEKVSGFVNTKGSLAYVPQQAWIQNATVRDNILFGHEMNKKMYVEAIRACALQQDLDMFVAGENTEIGEKGINISGGQKQRISLARAVYSNADIYFLDDPLSAVDSHVGKHIFENVIGPKGLLKGKTRLLVTHGVTYLPSMDLILVMKDGEISETGTYKELLDKKGAFADFLIHHMTETEDADEEKVLEEIISQDNELIERYNRQVSFKGRSDSISSWGSRRDSSSSSVNIKQSMKMYEENKLIEAEKSETGSVKLSVYCHYFKSAGMFLTVLTVVLAICVQVFTVVGQMWLSHWSTDTRVLVNGVQDRPKTNYYIGIYALLGCGQIMSIVLQSFCLALASLAAARWLHLAMLSSIMRAPMRFFDTTPTGRIINRFSKDIDVIDNLLPANLSGFIGCLCSVVSTLFVISFSTPIFIVIIIPIGILYFVIQRFYIAINRQLKRLESVSRSPIYSHFSESIAGATSIRAHQVQNRFIKQCEEKVDFNQICVYPSVVGNRWVSTRLETLGNAIILFAALFAVIGRDTLDAGIVGLSVTYALQVTLTLNYCVLMVSEVETNIVGVERLKEYTEVPQEAAWWISPRPDPSWPKVGRVEFREYALRYREGLDLVLKGISCTIEGGEKIGIVGRTGAGKSSLTLGLFRILEAAAGNILIDGIDISKIGLNDLRSKLTIIPQDPVLLSGTLRSNLDPFGSYNDDLIWQALELAHLSEFARSLEAGLDHQISEGGENLSVGQRQLICLARALLRKTKVLILDEATAAVDLETDDLIQRTIRTEFKECTVLTVAHRLNTILDSDRVMVLDKGYITEFDSPSALLKSKTSTFYSMARDAGIV